MKQRFTYILPPGTGLSAADVEVKSDSLGFAKGGFAVEEWRFTLGLGELPEELREVLQQSHELHMRWTAERNERSLPPMVSRLPPGLHVFFTPRNESANVPICAFVGRLLAPEKATCDSVGHSFSKPNVLSGRFAQSATWQWYQHARLRARIGDVVLKGACSNREDCHEIVDRLGAASYVDVDFDAISHAVTFTAVWSPFRAGMTADLEQARRTLRKRKLDDRLEIGTLQVEESKEAEELSLSGFLTVIGEDDRPNPTMFSFPSRHHPLPTSSRTSYRATFQQPTGLHPKLDIALSRRNLRPPKDSCALHAYWTLPSALFIDRYQLSDPLFLASQNLVSLRSLSGEEDLEAPDWAVERWGSAALLELAQPRTEDGEGDAFTVTIPTHLRYLAASANTTSEADLATLEVPWPTVFWACEAEEGLKMSNNPFDRINLGFDGLFGPKTMFYHIPPASDAGRLVSEVHVPVLNPHGAEHVRFGTAAAVLLGFGWVCWKMLKNVGGVTASTNSQAEGKKTR